MASSCLADIFFVFFTLSTWLLVLSPTNPAKQLTFFFYISADGRESPLPFYGPSQSFGFYLPPPWSGDFVRATRCHPSQVTEYRQVAPIYHHALTVILWGLATVNSNERIAVIPLPSSQWDITWQSVLGLLQEKHCLTRLIGLVGRVFTNGPGDEGSIPCRSYQRL